MFDNSDVRKRLPEASARIRVHVPDFPQGDGNVGLEDMVRGLGYSATDGEDAPRESPPPPPEAEAAAPKDASEAPPEGHKSLDVRVEWGRTSLLFSLPAMHSDNSDDLILPPPSSLTPSKQ